MYICDSATLSYLQLIRMIVDHVAGPSPFTLDPRRHRIMESSLTLPPGLRQTHLLPDRQTADILVSSFFTNVSPPRKSSKLLTRLRRTASSNSLTKEHFS